MSTKPRSGQTPSAKTISKLSKAMGDPTKTFYGRSLGRAPDGGAPADYSKGWRFLPADMVLPDNYKTGDGSHQASIPHPDGRPKVLGAPYTLHEIMLDQTHEGSDRTKPIKVTSFGIKVKQALKDLHSSQYAGVDNPKAQKVIDDAYHQLVLAPQIKAQEEQLAKQREAKELEYATLKMRVIELEKRPKPTPTAPAITKLPTSYLTKSVILLVFTSTLTVSPTLISGSA